MTTRFEDNPSYQEMLAQFHQGEWITARSIYNRAKGSGLQYGRFTCSTAKRYVYRAHEIGDVQAAVLPGHQVYQFSYSLPGTPMPEGAVKIPPGLGRNIAPYVNRERAAMVKPRARYKVATRDAVIAILENATSPMTAEEIANAGPFRPRAAQDRLYNARRSWGVNIVVTGGSDGEPVRYAIA